MKLNFYNKLILVFLGFIVQTRAQVTNHSITDTTKAARDKELINEYFKRQRDLVLQNDGNYSDIKNTDTTVYDNNTKLKFIILCFNLSKSYEEEIASLNKIANEYKKSLSSIVIKADDLNKYTEIFTSKEFNALQSFINNKNDKQKKDISFPVILILNKNGKVLNAWSGDKTEDGLKKEDYYAKIKAGLKSLPQQK